MPVALVTGGAGFLGSKVAVDLVRRGWTVRIVDDLSSGRLENLGPWRERVHCVVGDVCRQEDLLPIVSGADVIIHAAGLRSVVRSHEDPLRMQAVNAVATRSLLRAAVAAGVRRFIYASSAAVYSGLGPFPQAEDHALAPASPYASSKLAGEDACREYAGDGKLAVVVLRYFNIFGPGQAPASKYSGVISTFLKALEEKRACPICGDGQQARDFIYIDDAVAATWAACSRPELGSCVVNVGSGRPHTILEVMATLGEIMGQIAQPHFLPGRPGDVRKSQADVTRMRALLGDSPVTEFQMGLAQTLTWFRAARA